MSDPIDARVLRTMVREAAAEEMNVPDWDALEERLLARLDEPPSALSRALIESADTHVGTDDDESSLAERVLASGELGLEGELGGRENAAKIHFIGDDDCDSQERHVAAGEVVHSPSLIHEPPRLQRAAPKASRFVAVAAMLSIAACATFFLAGGSKLFGTEGDGRTTTATDAPIVAEHWVDPAEVPMAPGMDNVRDLSALHAGDVVEATQGAVSFGQKDQLTWTLSAGTRVLIRSGIEPTSLRHVVVLESGSIRADITTAGFTSLDPFVIEAGDTRVAADQTTFSVTRSSRGIVVDVEHGTATVGPREEIGLGTGHRLSSPLRASASLDGSREFKLLDAARVSSNDGVVPLPELRHDDDRSSKPDAHRTDADRRAADARSTEVPASSSSPSGPSTNTPAASSPAPSEVTLDEGTIRAMLNGCFADVEAKRKASAGGDASVSVSMRSTLHLGIADSTIKSASFNPPLRPDLQSCAVPLLRKKIVGATGALDLPLEIKR